MDLCLCTNADDSLIQPNVIGCSERSMIGQLNVAIIWLAWGNGGWSPLICVFVCTSTLEVFQNPQMQKGDLQMNRDRFTNAWRDLQMHRKRFI